MTKAEQLRQWRARNPGKAAKYSRAFRDRHPGYAAKTAKSFRQRHPDRVRKYESDYDIANREKDHAHKSVLRAIKTGKLKHEPCSICGSEPAEGHHEDYNKRLEVTWLCRRCHKARHSGYPVCTQPSYLQMTF